MTIQILKSHDRMFNCFSLKYDIKFQSEQYEYQNFMNLSFFYHQFFAVIDPLVT